MGGIRRLDLNIEWGRLMQCPHGRWPSLQGDVNGLCRNQLVKAVTRKYRWITNPGSGVSSVGIRTSNSCPPNVSCAISWTNNISFSPVRVRTPLISVTERWISSKKCRRGSAHTLYTVTRPLIHSEPFPRKYSHYQPLKTWNLGCNPNFLKPNLQNHFFWFAVGIQWELRDLFAGSACSYVSAVGLGTARCAQKITINPKCT